jgi:Holliday junction DNA helicase RuvA
VIAQVSGQLVRKELESVVVMTAGGVGYELSIPLGVYESLPRPGEPVTLQTHLVVREDGWLLFGFSSAFERDVFRRVLDAKGIGPSLALGMLSALTAERLVTAIREKDLVTLQSVPRVGRRKAEQLVLDLADKLDAFLGGAGQTPRPGAPGAEDAVRALVSLGYSPVDAERAVRAALEQDARITNATELIRRALTHVGGRR